MRPFNPSERYAVVGATGSGKSRAAEWIISQCPADFPWILIDQKHDAAPKLKPYTLTEALAKVRGRFFRAPKLPRILRVTPAEDEDKDEFDALFRAVLGRGNVGVWADEGMSLPHTKGLEMLYTQGRTRKTPVITCTQRPVEVPRVCISESSRFFVYRLIDKKDRERVRQFADVPDEVPERFHFLYYDAGIMKGDRYLPLPLVGLGLRNSDRR